MTPRETLAAASRVLKPLQQGELDGLCGLYAIINAIRLSLYPERRLSKAEAARLFTAGVTELRKARSLHGTILTGIHDPSWRRVGDAMAAEASKVFGARFLIDRFQFDAKLGDQEMLRVIRLVIRAGNPVLMRVQGPVDHWTVVCRFSKARLTLFDSSGLRWLPVSSITFSTKRTNRYRVPRRGIAVVLRLPDRLPPELPDRPG